MKPKEFYELMQEFVDEDRRWRELKEGDTIYDQGCAGIAFEYFKMIIDKIDIAERYVVAHDEADSSHIKTLGGFLTQKEFEKL